MLLYALILLSGLVLLALYHGGILPLGEISLARNLYGASYTQASLTLVLSLVMLRYVDNALLNNKAKAFVRISIPAAAIFGAVAMVLAVPGPEAGISWLVSVTYLSAAALIAGCVILAVGLLRR